MGLQSNNLFDTNNTNFTSNIAYEYKSAEAQQAESSLGEHKQKNKRAFHNDLLPRGLLP